MEKVPASGQPTKLTITHGEELGELQRDIQKAIAYRAYELYASRGRSHGHDLEDWLHAESDLLKPAEVQITDAGAQWIVKARTPGFSAGEIRIGAAPRKVVIWAQASRPGSTASRYAQQLLGEIELPSAVKPEQASATLTGEFLEVRLPKEGRGS